MFRFGFKKTFRLKSRKKTETEHESAGEPVCGAYRVNIDEFTNSNIGTTPKVQTTYTQPQLKPSKSSNDIDMRATPPTDIRQSVPDTAQMRTPKLSNNASKENRGIEQKQLAEQKKQQKLAAQEHERQEKIKKEREKKEAKSHKTKPNKYIAPQAQTNRDPPALKKYPPNIPETTLVPPNYSTNTLESSISRTSGPPPYTPHENLVQNIKDKSGNTSFTKEAEEDSSWDMISQHREHLKSSKPIGGNSKLTHMDLKYNIVDSSNDKDNSEA